MHEPIDPKLPLTSHDLAAERLALLRGLVPDAFAEGVLDTEKLKYLIGQTVPGGPERYGLSWAGKAEALRAVQSLSTATLRPVPEQSVEFDTTANLIIEGDNLEVLKLLQKSYHRRVKMIYIDPPYNTGNEFIYPDNFRKGLQTYLEYTGQARNGVRQTTNAETSGRYHSNWLTMMYPRLFLARNLLRDDGVIFVSIDDHEVHNLRLLMNEVFGEENFVAVFPWRKRTAKSDVPFGVSQDYEWIMCFAHGSFQAGIGYERKYYQTPDFPNDRWRLADLTKQTSAGERPNSAFDMINPKTGSVYRFNPNRAWSVTRDTFQKYYDEGKIVFPGDYDFLRITIPAYRVFESEDKAKAVKKYGLEDAIKAVSTQLPKEVGMSEDGNKDMVELFGEKVFSFPKPASLVKYLLTITNEKDDTIILDFFAGSGTVAEAVMELNAEDGGNRRFILVQLPEPTGRSDFPTIADITRERVRRAAARLHAAKNGRLPNLDAAQDRGFKAFTLAESNFQVWDADAANGDGATLAEQLRLYADHRIANRSAQDVLYELLLKSGRSLSAPIVDYTIAEQTVYDVDNGQVLICLADPISEDTLRGMIERQPERVVCLDAAFNGNDQLKTNIVLQMRDAGVEFRTV